MVSIRCNKYVRSELMKLEIHTVRVEPGIVEFEKQLTEAQLNSLSISVAKLGMELLDAEHGEIMTNLLNELYKKIYSSDSNPTKDFLLTICKNQGKSYSEVSSLFSELKGIDLAQYIELRRVERVKEILVYEDHTLSTISTLMDYKNPAQLTRIFKKATGLTPFYYKQLRKERVANIKKLPPSSVSTNYTNLN